MAQRPGSYEILKYVRPVVKRKDTQQISCALAPVAVIDGSRADVSFVAGLLVDKFAYHLPLYRQHLRLTDCGLKVSRPWLTQLSQKSISSLEPIYQAQLDSIRGSHVIALDETPIKADRNGQGKMKMEYFWPVYGEQHEVCFPFFTSRATEVVHRLLGITPTANTVLLTDGYAVYQRYAKQYVILDIFSRSAVGWMIAPRESAHLAEQLIAETIDKQNIAPGTLTLHADRGTSMRSKPVAALLVDLEVTRTHSRPHVSDDNPYSEAQFKTLKYRPNFPPRFGSIQDARAHCQDFFRWYNTEHRHPGIGFMTPDTVVVRNNLV